MKAFVFVLLVLVCNASAGRRYRGRNPMPQPEGPCDMIQPFDQDFIYTYEYKAVTEHRDEHNRRGNNVKISCTATISVPRRCSGKLRVSNCRVESGTMTSTGSINYSPSPLSAGFDREMGVSEMAFHFNGGQITRVYVDKQERSNITNIKRGILSSLQAYNPALPKEFSVGDIYEVPQTSVYGQGIVRHRIVEKIGQLPSVVQIVRDTSDIELPWERRQWNFIRMRNNRLNPLVSGFKNYITIASEERWARAKQSCTYQLQRGRQVKSANCEESYPLNPIKPQFASSMMEGEPLETRIRQEINMRSSRRMTSQDKSQWDVTRFDEDNIMFEEEWEETNMIYSRGFDAAETFLNLVRLPVNDKAPALISKLSRWLAVAGQAEIEAVWAKCEAQCTPEQKKEGRVLYAELLNSCITNDWCQIPYCSNENSTSCEDALESFIRTTSDESEEIKKACLVSLDSIFAPSPKIVDAALRICRSEERPSRECVETLGAVTKNFLETCGSDCVNKKPVENAKTFLVRQLKRDCQTNNPEIEEVMVAAAECLGRLGEKGEFAAETLLTCSVNPQAPPRVAVKSLVAYGNTTGETLPNPALAKLVEVFTKKNAQFETRVTCFHVLMKKNVPMTELQKVLATVMDESQHPALLRHCREDLRIQMMLRGTVFCNFHPEVAEKCARTILRNRWDIGLSNEVLEKKPVEKSYEMTRNFLIPYLNVTTNCTVRLTSAYENSGALMPIISKLSVEAMIDGRNMTVMEAALDIAGMKPVLDRIFGHNNFYADLFGKLLKTPMGKLQNYAKQYPAWNELRDEAQFAYLASIFEPRSPLHLKVFGYPISLDALTSWGFIRKMTLESMWKFHELLQQGFEHESFVAGQPFLMQHAAPTCIGAPIVSTIDLSYVFKNKMNWKADIRKMLFSPNENAVFNIAPEMHVTGSIRRTVLAQFSESCGTELLFKIGHGSAVDCKANTDPTGLNVVCKPKPGKSQVFYLKGRRSLSGPSTDEPAASVCIDYRMRNLCNLQVCHQPFNQEGFAYEMNIENELDTEYQAAFNWVRSREPTTNMEVQDMKVECTAVNRAAPSSKKVVWSSVLGKIPERGELHWDINCEWLNTRGKTDFFFYRNPETSLIEGCFSSYNRSSLGSLEIRHFSTFGIVPDSGKKQVIFGESKSLGAGGELIVGYKLAGAIDEVAEGANTSRKIYVDFTDMAPGSSPHLSYNFLAKKVPSGVGGMPGYETRTVLSGPTIPYYEKIECEMMTYDNDVRYEKVMRLVGHLAGEGINPHFIGHRINGTLKQPSSPAYSADTWLVSNWLDLAIGVKVDEFDDITSSGKVYFPENAITYNVIFAKELQFAHNPERYSGRAEGAKLGYNFITKRQPDGQRDFEISFGNKFWNPEERAYKSEYGTAKYTNYKECSYCHSFVVDHPKVKVSSISRYSKYFHEEKWLKLHYSLLNYITVRPYISYYLINNLKNEYVQVGYKLYNSRSSGIPEKIEVSGALLKNFANCSARYESEKLFIESNCTLDVPMISLMSNISLNVSAKEDERPLLAIRTANILGEAGWVVDGEMFYSIQSQDIKCHVNATYGSYPALEQQSILDLSMLKSTGNSQYDITGSFKNTYRPRAETKVYNYAGTSKQINGGRTDLELRVMCPSATDKVCGEVTVNRGEEWIKYKRLVTDDDYDYTTIRYAEDRNTYKMETKMTNDIAWGVKHLNFTLEAGKSAIGVGIESQICNASVRYSDASGIEVSSIFNTTWLENRVIIALNSASAKYEFFWNTMKIGGSFFSNNMSVNYDILNFGKPFNAKLNFGSTPNALLCDFKMPDLDFALEMRREFERPTEWRYMCNALIEPKKITIEKLRIPFFYRRIIELAHTTVAWKYQDGRFQGLTANDVSFKWDVLPWGPCHQATPIEVTGQCDISFEKFLVKLADENRNFVLDISFDPATPLQHRFEYVFTLMNTRVEMLWDMKNENSKWMIASKCELSRMCWKTKTIRPVFTIFFSNEIGETPEHANFPPMNMVYRLNHTLWIPLVNELEFSVVSTVTGSSTRIVQTDKIGSSFYSGGSTTTLTGCHRRMAILPGISACIPIHFDSDVTYKLPNLVGKDHYVASVSSRGEWTIKAVSDFTAPMTSGNEVAHMSLGMNVEAAECPADVWCIPRTLHFKDIEVDSSKLANELTLNILPFNSLYRPSEVYDFKLRNSDVMISRERSGEHNIHQVSYNLRRPDTNAEMTMTLTARISLEKMECKIDMTNGDWHFKNEMETSCDLDTWAWDYKHSLECPWMVASTTMKASSLFTITSCEMMMKMPNGLIKNFLLDYTTTPHKFSSEVELQMNGNTGKGTHEMTWDPSTMIWQCHDTISCSWMNMDMTAKGSWFIPSKMDMTLKSKGMIKDIEIHFGEGIPPKFICTIGSVDLELLKTGSQYVLKFGCGSFPALNQTFYLEPSASGRQTNWNFRHQCQYFICTAKFNNEGYTLYPKEVDCRMKNSLTGAKVEYVEESNGKLCRMTFKSNDGSRFSCLSTPMRNERTKARLDCRKLAGSSNTKFASIPVTMQDFPFMGGYLVRDKALFLARCAEALYKTVTYDEKSLGQELQKKIQCTDENICREIADKVKGIQYSSTQELKRLAGPKMYYIMKPELGEYAIYNTLSYIPGSVTFLPHWTTVDSFSPTNYVKKLLTGDEVSLVHWNFQPFIELKTGIKLLSGDNFVVLCEIGSMKFPWFGGALSVGTEEIEGVRIANVTLDIAPYKSRVIARINNQNIRILTAEACVDNCKKSIIVLMNEARTSDGRNNVTFLLMQDGAAEYACDILTRPDAWSDSVIKLYKGISREEVIGHLSLPSVPKPSSYDYTDFDRVLREVLHIHSANERSKITEVAGKYVKYVTDSAYRTVYPTAGTYGMTSRITHYVLSSILHEATKYDYHDELSSILGKFWRKSYNLDPNFKETYNNLVDYVSGIDLSGEIGVIVQNMMTPILDAVGYALDGHVAATCEVHNGEIMIHTHIFSYRYPMINFTNTIRVRRSSWMEMVVNVTTSNTFINMTTDARLYGPKIYIDRVKFALPEASSPEFLEIKMAPSPAVPGLYETDVIIADNAGQHYGCRGARPSVLTPMLHFHCYTIDGDDIPRNPSSATMFAHWDVNIEGLPHASTGAITGTIRTIIVLFRTISACHEDSSSIDKILLERFNIHDVKIRQRLARTFNDLCTRWVNEFKSDPALPAPALYGTNSATVAESKYITMTRKYKEISYDSMMHYVKGDVSGPAGPQDIMIWDFKEFVNVAIVVYPYCAPAIYTAVAVIEYVEPTAVFNVSRCTRCPTTLGKSKVHMMMKSPIFSFLNHEANITMTSEGVINSSMSNDLAWGWIECEIRGFRVVFTKGQFGLATNRNGVEVVFWPEMTSYEMSGPSPPLMSLRFTTNQRYTCDVTSKTWLSTEVKCHPYKSGSRGPEACTCNIKPVQIVSECGGLVYESVMGFPPKPNKIGGVIDRSCTVKDATFKESVSSSLSSDIGFIGVYGRKQISSWVKAFGDVLSSSYSYMWKVSVEMVSWIKDMISAGEGISIRKLTNRVQEGIEVFIGWCKDITWGVYDITTVFYQSGYVSNKVAYEIPEYLTSMGEYTGAITPKYTHIPYYYYMKTWIENAMQPANCIAGIMSGNGVEQLISFNNYMYNMPKTIKKCSFLLAGRQQQDFAITLEKNMVAMRLSDTVITIEPDMRVYLERTKESVRSEVALPIFEENDVSCTRTEHSIECTTKYFKLIAKGNNNERTAVFLIMSEGYCENTFGLFGRGANKTVIQERLMLDGRVADNMKDFIESYRTVKGCDIGSVPPEPTVSHTYCDPLFNNDDWINNCPIRRRSIMKACQTSATSVRDACRYIKHYGMLCGLEEKPVKLPAKCEVCKGRQTVEKTLEKVRITVVMALSRKTSIESVPEILEAVRSIASENYELSFVTFGGNGYMSSPHFNATNGKVWMPQSDPWNILPRAPFDGPAPTHDMMNKAMCFAYDKNRLAAEGYGKIFLFVAPEDMDFSSMASLPCVQSMKDDMIESYLLIPTICQKRGAKAGTTMGVRPLFTPSPQDICAKTPAEVATAISYHHLNKRVTCKCVVINPYTGRTQDKCALA